MSALRSRTVVFGVYLVFVFALLIAPVSSTSVGIRLPVDPDKIAHFGLMGGLAFLEFWRLQGSDWFRSLNGIWWAGGVAAGTELIQATLPYRSGDWKDFVAGAVGGLAGAVAATTLRRAWSAMSSSAEPIG